MTAKGYQGRAAPRSLSGITAVILNWRTPDLTVRCARALLSAGMNAGRIIIVDNGSPSGLGVIREGVPDCRLLELPSNVGFARGNNLGAAMDPGASGYLFVNSDAFIRGGDSLHSLTDALARHRVGVVVPRLLHEDLRLQHSVRPFLRPSVAALRASGLERFVPDGQQPHLGSRWSHRRSRVVESATGAVMLVRGQAWRELGGFDESSFMYAEDIDLCWRARALGWATWFSAEAEWIHLENSSAALSWTDSERWERIGRAEGALIRRQMEPRAAALTLALLRAGLMSRELAWRLLRVPDKADAWKAQRRGYERRT